MSLLNVIRMLAGVMVVVSMTGCMSGPVEGTDVTPFRPVMDRTITPYVKPAPMRTTMAKPRVERPAAPVVATPAAPAETNQLSEFALDNAERLLKKGDRVQLTIYAPPQPFTCQNVIDEDGRINFPLIGLMKVAGKSCGEAQREVEKAYIDQKIYKNVTVMIVPPEGEYAVTGEVIRPGPYPLARDLTLIQALGRAGRYTEYADKTRVFITRNNERAEIKLDDIQKGRRRDIVIIPGDVIEVPRRWY